MCFLSLPYLVHCTCPESSSLHPVRYTAQWRRKFAVLTGGTDVLLLRLGPCHLPHAHRRKNVHRRFEHAAHLLLFDLVMAMPASAEAKRAPSTWRSPANSRATFLVSAQLQRPRPGPVNHDHWNEEARRTHRHQTHTHERRRARTIFCTVRRERPARAPGDSGEKDRHARTAGKCFRTGPRRRPTSRPRPGRVHNRD